MGKGYGIEQWETEEMDERMKGLDPIFDNHPSVVEQRKLRDKLIQDIQRKQNMQFWGHSFTDFKSCERICWACGYVIDRDSSEAEVKRWIRREEGGELHCGNRWGKYEIRRS
jgi:hypothetical protein